MSYDCVNKQKIFVNVWTLFCLSATCDRSVQGDELTDPQHQGEVKVTSNSSYARVGLGRR